MGKDEHRADYNSIKATKYLQRIVMSHIDCHRRAEVGRDHLHLTPDALAPSWTSCRSDGHCSHTLPPCLD